MNIPCIVLAGGLGTRLRTAVPNSPKCLAPIAGKPFLEWQLMSLSDRGINHFILALGHGANDVLEFLKKPWASLLKIDTVVEKELLGTGGAAMLAMDKLLLDEALIVNGDTYLGGSLVDMFSPLDIKNNELMRIATVRVPDKSRFGGVSLLNKTRIVEAFIDKHEHGAGLINAGLYRIHRSAFDCVDQKIFSIETKIMQQLVEKRTLHAVEVVGPFIDMGVPEDYHLLTANAFNYFSKA